MNTTIGIWAIIALLSVTAAAAANSAPSITVAQDVYQIKEMQQLSISATAVDPDGDPITFSAAVSGDQGKVKDTWFGTKAIGQEDIDILVPYFANAAIYRSDFDLNNDGEISILDIAAIAQRLGAHEGEQSYVPAYDLSTKLNVPAALFSWTPASTLLPYGQLQFTVTITAQDSNGASAAKSVKVFVDNNNRLPSKPEAISPENGAESIPLNTPLSWKSTDADGDSLFYHIYFGTSPSTLGLLEKISKPQGEAVTYQATGLTAGTTYYWRVWVRDGKDNPESRFIEGDLFSFKTQAAQPPTPPPPTGGSNGGGTTPPPATTNQAPAISSTPVAVAVVGAAYSYQVAAADAENNVPLAYSISGPAGMAISTAGLVIWTPTAQQAGSHPVTVVVRDSLNNARDQAYTVVVGQPGVNNAPVITASSPQQAALILPDMVDQVFSVTASDPDGDPLTYSWTYNGVDAGVSTSSYTFNKQISAYTVVATVSDGTATATRSWNVEVVSRPATTGFDGTTTNFLTFSSDAALSQAANIVLEKSAAGKIDFGSSVLDLRNVADIPGSVLIGDGIVAVDSGRYPQLNKPATVTMRNVNLAGTPAVFVSSAFTSDKNAVTAPCGAACSNINYNTATKVLTFTVSGFSTYVARDAGKLIVSDLDVKVGGSTSSNVASGATVSKKAKPGDTVELRMKVKNTFTSAQDIEIKDILVTGTIRSIDDGADLDEDSEEFDLRADREKSVTLRYTVPFDVSADTYQVLIEGDGSGDDGQAHRISYTVQLTVEKDSHDVRITEAAVGNPELSCIRRTTLNLEVMNVGRNEEDVRVEVKGEQLGVELAQSLVLDDTAFSEDNSWQKSITIDASGLQPGSYPLQITLFRDGSQEESRNIDILVSGCVLPPAQTAGPDSDVDVVLPTPQQGAAQQGSDGLYVIGLAGAAAIVLILVIAGFAVLARKGRRRGMKHIGRR